ncbi:alpha/beta fold hydrolase [Nesterenkonia aurantiaca]|uniref:Alpha/beta hydrolase family protein n=1 Tax=Nesterenkonia aurantiaca TaxID=1436010 RepID=A0A4R7G484_9MICC|nr:alpha/beta fold hydrolase [Nesterenkonia aurantiaca]TDS86119.1 alpha/beta hydrolase family protein [Nesterenkonia aurantiaca]
MARLEFPAPESVRTPAGLTLHTWTHQDPTGPPVLLIHGFASSTLFNWVKTGWLDPLARTGRSIIAVDLPGHGASQDLNPVEVRVRDILADLSSHLLQQGHETVAVHGYSLGSRLAWEFSAAHPEMVTHLVMGGSPTDDRLGALKAKQARLWVQEGVRPVDDLTRNLVTLAGALPGANVPHTVELLLSLSADPYDPASSVPPVPTLVVAGSQDEIAAEAASLVPLVTARGAVAAFVQIPERDHINAVTSRDYKAAVVSFLQTG